MKDVKRTVKGVSTKGKGSIPGKVRVHPHTAKQMKAVAINTKKNVTGGSTGNGLSGADDRY